MFAFLVGGCVDAEYDLDKIDADDIAIGGDDSRFLMPLASIRIGAEELGAGGTGIVAICDEIDIWLPTTLPGDADHVDLVRFSDDADYRDSLLDGLIAEMRDPASAKMSAMVDLLWRTPGYRMRFVDLVPSGEEAQFKRSFEELFRSGEAGGLLEERLCELAGDFLGDVAIDPVAYAADLGLGDDVIDMLCENLDPLGTADPVNVLVLYGEVESLLPVAFRLAPVFPGPDVATAPFEVSPAVAAQLPETLFFREQVRPLLESFGVRLSFDPLRYYPGEGLREGQEIRVRLRLKKLGGLSLNF
ncbi:MAG: hypothetical protein K2H69_04450 [Alistipes sp.]|nr:hypothetical protein [Alistipes sp.]